MVFNIMLGIKKSIDATIDLPLRLDEKQFKVKGKYEIAPYRTDPADYVKICEFYDYAPQVFASIRKACGVQKH